MASVNNLQACLTQECHHREDLEVKVLTLEKDHQWMEVENQSLAERLSRSTDQQKGMTLDLVLLMLRVVKCLPVVCSPRDGSQPFS